MPLGPAPQRQASTHQKHASRHAVRPPAPAPCHKAHQLHQLQRSEGTRWRLGTRQASKRVAEQCLAPTARRVPPVPRGCQGRESRAPESHGWRGRHCIAAARACSTPASESINSRPIAWDPGGAWGRIACHPSSSGGLGIKGGSIGGHNEMLSVPWRREQALPAPRRQGDSVRQRLRP